jgi:hypothetical protein
MPIATNPVIDADHAAFMQRGVALNVAACGPGGLPSIARALGCRLSADGRRVRLMLSSVQGAELLAHVAASGKLAAVFCDPSTQRTVQLKSDAAVIAAPEVADLQAVARYRAAWLQALVPLGYEQRLAEALTACSDAELAVLEFAPSEAYSQTPGPNAGQPLLVAA